MKKIALLFTILGVGALSGMEVPKTEILGKGMPADVKRIVVSLVSNYKNVTDAVKAIEGLSLTNKQLGNLINAQYGKFYDMQGFTALVHFIANKYDKTTETVALLFEAPIAKTYLKLGRTLTLTMPAAMAYPNTELPKTIVDLIKEGADVNYTGHFETPVGSLLVSPMIYALQQESTEFIKLLVEAGAHIQSDAYYDASSAWPKKPVAKAKMKALLDEIRKGNQ